MTQECQEGRRKQFFTARNAKKNQGKNMQRQRQHINDPTKVETYYNGNLSHTFTKTENLWPRDKVCTTKCFLQKLLKKFVVHIFTLLVAPFSSKLVNYSKHSKSLKNAWTSRNCWFWCNIIGQNKLLCIWQEAVLLQNCKISYFFSKLC